MASACEATAEASSSISAESTASPTRWRNSASIHSALRSSSSAHWRLDSISGGSYSLADVAGGRLERHLLDRDHPAPLLNPTPRRRGFPAVYSSLLAIHRAQTRSLDQQRLLLCAPEILRISVERHSLTRFSYWRKMHGSLLERYRRLGEQLSRKFPHGSIFEAMGPGGVVAAT